MAAAVILAHPSQNIWQRVYAFAGYGGSVLLVQALRFAISILCARLVGPSEWGFWTLLNTVLVVVQTVAAVCTAAAVGCFLALGRGLEGAALGATLGSCIYCGGLILAMKRLLTKV